MFDEEEEEGVEGARLGESWVRTNHMLLYSHASITRGLASGRKRSLMYFSCTPHTACCQSSSF